MSSFGWGIGYLGGGLLLLNLILYTFSDLILGPDSGGLAVRINLGSAGIWWLGWQLITFSRLRRRKPAVSWSAPSSRKRARPRWNAQ